MKADVARRQLDEEAGTRDDAPRKDDEVTMDDDPTGRGRRVQRPDPTRILKRFHGSATLDTQRVGRDASEIAAEVVAHLAGLPGARVKVTLEIQAEIPNGAPENVERIVTENARTLKFDSAGFEEE